MSKLRSTALSDEGQTKMPKSCLYAQQKGFFAEFLGNMDAAIDDFMNKRMGNGEVFYGKRKYKPSGRFTGDYNGMGLSDKLRIDQTREMREEYLEEREERRRRERLEEE